MRLVNIPPLQSNPPKWKSENWTEWRNPMEYRGIVKLEESSLCSASLIYVITRASERVGVYKGVTVRHSPTFDEMHLNSSPLMNIPGKCALITPADLRRP